MSHQLQAEMISARSADLSRNAERHAQTADFRAPRRERVQRESRIRRTALRLHLAPRTARQV